MKQDKKFANEISKILNLPILVLSSNAHNGLDYIHSLLDSHDQIIILPAFSYFRFLDKEKIEQDLFKNKKKLIKLIANILFKKKSYNVPRRKFFRNKKEKKIFIQHLSNFFYECEINHKTLFYGIHYAFLKVKNDNFFLKKIIISHEHMIWNNEKYFIFDNIKFSFVIRDPRAAIAGSILQMKKINQDNFLESHQMNKILINFISGWNFIKNQKKYNHKNVYFFINEKFNKNLKLEMKKFCRWSGLRFKPKMLVSTFNNKNWSGESSYLMKNKIDLNKKVPKNYYNSNNVKKRWLSSISENEIKTIESFCFDYMKTFRYQAIYIRSNFQRIINLYRIFLFYTLPRFTSKKSSIMWYLKNIIKRFFVVLLTKKSIKVLSIK
jgi:hypothetical protein